MRREEVEQRYVMICELGRQLGRQLGSDPEVQAALHDLEPGFAELCGAFNEGLREACPPAREGYAT